MRDQHLGLNGKIAVLLTTVVGTMAVQSSAADKRSEQTYNDAEAILQECLGLQKHL